jgi:periplasmic protein TonB
MARHLDVLDERDSLRGPFLGSIGLHVAVFGSLAILAVLPVGKREPWGDPNSLGGGAVGITPVKSLPFPARTGPKNPVANDTQSQVPSPPKPEPKAKRAVRDDPDAIALKSKKAKSRPEREERWASARPARDYSDNQVYSRGGAAAASPLFSQTPGSGGVGVGSGTPFGTRFGAYSALLRDRVAQRWRTDQVDARIRALPVAIVTFEVLRTGQVRNIRVAQSSGNRALDYSAERAITEAGPFEPLPAAFDGSYAVIEFWFELKR